MDDAMDPEQAVQTPGRRRIYGRPSSYNLVTDPEEYPRFDSFEERRDYIRESLVNDFLEDVENMVREQFEAELSEASSSGTQQAGSEDDEDLDEDDMGDSPGMGLDPRGRRGESPQRTQSRDRTRSRSRDSMSGTSGNGDPHSSRLRDRARRSGSSESRSSQGSRDRFRSRSRSRSPEGARHRRNQIVDNNDPGPARTARADVLLSIVEEQIMTHIDKMTISFVGDQRPELEFQPWRGDLIIAHPGGRHLNLPNSVGYLASYIGPNSHQFSNRELVVRMGDFEVRPPLPGGPNFVYRPYRNLELYAYNVVGALSWKYLGSQAPMKKTFIPFDNSPGKYLKVGSPVLGSEHEQFQALVPRRGDVIIKKDAWNENFNHEKNYWRSMVKWHRDMLVNWAPGDMLVRCFVDGEQSRRDQPQGWGWAELYEVQSGGPRLAWVFWGRTLHVYDSPWPSRNSFYEITYVCDDGKDSDYESGPESGSESN